MLAGGFRGFGGSTAAVEGKILARGVSAGALALASDSTPVVAYVRGRTLSVSRQAPNGDWHVTGTTALRRAAGYRLQLAVGRGGRIAVLVQDAAGQWLGLAVVGVGRTSWQLVDRRGRLGPAGLALDARDRPVIASAYGAGTSASYLRVLHVTGPRAGWEHVTKLGFPGSVTAPAAMPVLLPDGRVHVVESFGARGWVGGIEWGRESDGWWGQSLSAGDYERATGPVVVASGSGILYSAWTAIGFGREFVVLARRHGGTQESSVVQDGTLAGLAVTRQGPELAVNRRSGEAAIVAGGRQVASIRGRVLGFADSAKRGRQVLVVRDGALSLLTA